MAGEITAPYLPPQGPEYDTEVQKAGPLLSSGTIRGVSYALDFI